MAKGPKKINENLAEYGGKARVERGPAPGEVDKVSRNPNHQIDYVWYVFQLDDGKTQTESQDGVWKEVGQYKTEEAAHQQAEKL